MKLLGGESMTIHLKEDLSLDRWGDSEKPFPCICCFSNAYSSKYTKVSYFEVAYSAALLMSKYEEAR